MPQSHSVTLMHQHGASQIVAFNSEVLCYTTWICPVIFKLTVDDWVVGLWEEAEWAELNRHRTSDSVLVSKNISFKICHLVICGGTKEMKETTMVPAGAQIKRMTDLTELLLRNTAGPGSPGQWEFCGNLYNKSNTLQCAWWIIEQRTSLAGTAVRSPPAWYRNLGGNWVTANVSCYKLLDSDLWRFGRETSL